LYGNNLGTAQNGYQNGFVGTVGNTPLIQLNSFSETGCEILAKAEFLNPGGERPGALHYSKPKKKVCSNRVARW